MNALDALIAEGYEARQRGDLKAARERFERAVEQSIRDRELVSLARAHAGRGQIQRDMGRQEGAFAAYEESASIARRIGNGAVLANALRHMADLARKLGRVDEGLNFSLEAVRLLREDSGATLDLANALRVNALLLEVLKGDAEPAWLEARDLYEASGIEAGVAECEAHLHSHD